MRPARPAAGRGSSAIRRQKRRDALTSTDTDRPTDGDESVAPADTTGPRTTFRTLGVLPEIADALDKVGIVEPFPIQEMTLPVALVGSDVIGQARTGTGKTLGFGIPLLQRIVAPDDRDYSDLAEPGRPQALVVVPTRELAIQVSKDLQTASAVRRMRVLTVYGGRAYEPQVAALRSGVDVVVGTPGRLLDLMGQGELVLGHVKVLVLDEADEMLDLGFLPDVEKLVAATPELRQTMLFSATMPAAVVSLARRYMRHPLNVRAESADDTQTVPTTAQFVYRAHSLDKDEIIARVLQAEGRGLAMIFCRTKRQAQRISDELADRGFAAASVHGDLGQGAREQALRAFRNGKVDVLVATDVAARGIDVEGVTHVINVACPEDEKTYLHRIGRTGRAGASGVAVTLVDWDDMARWKMINTALDLPYPEPAETYSTSEALYHDLGIPPGTTGVLPSAQRTRAGLGAEVVEDLGETGRGGRPGARGARGDRGDRRGGGRAERPGQGGRPGRSQRSGGSERSGGGERSGGSERPGSRERPGSGEWPSSNERSGGSERPGSSERSGGEGEAGEELRRPRRSRSRRRTRRGQPLQGDGGSTAQGGAAREGGEPETGSASPDAGGTSTGRRRRRRGGGRSTTGESAAPAESSAGQD